DPRRDAPPARGPAAVRDQRRREGLGPARRPDEGGARRGRAHRQLQPRRRLQGHLGALRRRPAHPGRAPAAAAAAAGLRRAAGGPGPVRGRARRAGTAAAAGPAGRGRAGPRRRAAGAGRYAVLSRIAESLYWIGRYLERAEDTSRLLDVHLTLL